jgi:two-component system sensor histidine kinase AlgZ
MHGSSTLASKRAFDLNNKAEQTEQRAELLPEFCRGRIIIDVMIFAELLAILIVVIGQQFSSNVFKDLLLLSLFVQWLALAKAASLCVMRQHLNRLTPMRAFIMAYLVLLCVAWAVGELTLLVTWAAGMTRSIRPEWYTYFQAQNLTACAIIDAMALRYFFARHQLKLSSFAEAQARQEILKYRIRPHFLFNSMNIIASLTRRSPSKAESAIEDMADVFRLMLDENKNLMPVKNEIEVAKKYLALEKLRLEKRLQVTWDVVELPRRAKMPVLMLQLLLESAIHLAIEPAAEGGEIAITLTVIDDLLHLSVTSPLPQEGLDEARLNRMALDNIRQRLYSHYQHEARLDTHQDEKTFTIKITAPAFGGDE